MIVFTVQDPCFKTEPLFVLDCTQAQLKRYLLRRFNVTIETEDRLAGRMFTFGQSPWRVVWSLKRDLPVVLHECFHLVTRICQDKGIPIVAHHPDGMNGDETAAHLFEHFARRIVRRVR